VTPLVAKSPKTVPEDLDNLKSIDSMSRELLIVEFQVEVSRSELAPVDHDSFYAPSRPVGSTGCHSRQSRYPTALLDAVSTRSPSGARRMALSASLVTVGICTAIRHLGSLNRGQMGQVEETILRWLELACSAPSSSCLSTRCSNRVDERIAEVASSLPTLLRSKGLRIYITSHDAGEPPHVHVDHQRSSAKFWLSPVRLAVAFGFSTRELNAVERLVLENETILLKGWNDYFGA
jgi:hypothetical protein